MDLSRAKTVLIIAFLALNFFLVYQNILQYRNEDVRVNITSDDFGQIKTILEKNNIHLRVSIPRVMQEGAFLNVVPEEISPQRMLQVFFPDQDGLEQHVKGDETIIYKQGNRSLTLFPTGRMVYECNLDLKPGRQIEFDENQARQEAEDFLNVKSLKPDNAALDYIELNQNNGNVVVHYYQEINDIPIFSGYGRITVSDMGVERADIYWLCPLGLSEKKDLKIIPATLALRRFAEEYGSQIEAITYITNLSFGFYSQEYDAEMWEMAPVWRIQLNGYNGKIYYINALTGNIEE